MTAIADSRSRIATAVAVIDRDVEALNNLDPWELLHIVSPRKV